MYPLSSLGKLSQGLSFTRYRGSAGEGNPYRVVQVTDLDHCYLSSQMEIIHLELPSVKDYRLQVGDLVITIRGSTRKASVVGSEGVSDDQGVPAIATSNLAVFRPFLHLTVPLDPLFLVCLFRSSLLENSLNKLYGQSKSTRSLNLKQLEQLEIPLPSLEYQQRFGQMFLDLETCQQESQRRLEVMQKLLEKEVTRISMNGVGAES